MGSVSRRSDKGFINVVELNWNYDCCWLWMLRCERWCVERWDRPVIWDNARANGVKCQGGSNDSDELENAPDDNHSWCHFSSSDLLLNAAKRFDKCSLCKKDETEGALVADG